MKLFSRDTFVEINSKRRNSCHSWRLLLNRRYPNGVYCCLVETFFLDEIWSANALGIILLFSSCAHGLPNDNSSLRLNFINSIRFNSSFVLFCFVKFSVCFVFVSFSKPTWSRFLPRWHVANSAGIHWNGDGTFSTELIARLV